MKSFEQAKCDPQSPSQYRALSTLAAFGVGVVIIHDRFSSSARTHGIIEHLFHIDSTLRTCAVVGCVVVLSRDGCLFVSHLAKSFQVTLRPDKEDRKEVEPIFLQGFIDHIKVA